MSKLTAKKVENALPREKEYKLHDGGGLFLRIRPSGAKSWLFSFSLPNDRKLIRMTLGSLKDISLKEARAKLPELHAQVSQGIDPRTTRAAKQTISKFLMLQSNHILTGKYVKLEPLSVTHRNTLKILSQDERISTYSPALKLNFNTWFDKALQSPPIARQLTFIVRTVNDNKIVGTTRFYDIYPEHKRLTIGYTWYIPEVWGSFVNAECKLLLLRYAFETLEVNRIEFFIDSRNKRSLAAVKKLGAIEEGLLRQHIVLEDGFMRDTVVYSILKQEWSNVLANLEKRLKPG